jgi:hypothetical protein
MIYGGDTDYGDGDDDVNGDEKGYTLRELSSRYC